MRLYLDDKGLVPTGFHKHTRTAWEAIEVLKSNAVTLLSFDYDLGNPGFAGTGVDVAKWIEDQAAAGSLKPFKWEIHSEPCEGTEKIEEIMLRAENFWFNE